MKKTIDLSIIIPIYNAEKYLDECLKSVVNQKLENYEIICVDDGSTDSSAQILNEYRKKYNNIKIIKKGNGGVISARIAGYNAASGRYIGWVDSDDFVSSNMFDKMLSLAIENDADMVYCNYDFYPSKVINKQKWYKSYQGVVNWNLVLNNTIQWNKIVKKDLLNQLDISELFNSIGEGCYGLVFINSKKIISLDEQLYFYRVGHTSLSSNFNDISWYEKVAYRSKNMLNYVKNKNYDEYWIDYYSYRFLYYNLMVMIVAAYNNNKEKYLYSKKIISVGRLFSSENKDYLKASFSKLKLLFLKYFGSKSFIAMRFVTKILFK